MPDPSAATPLSAEDLAFWYADQPRQRTTMAMLMLLDTPPDRERLRAAMARAVEAVPRLRQRVVDAPFDLARPRWEDDPTFDLDFHVRRYSLAADTGARDDLEGLFRTVGPIYERPFDRTRPLWELVELDHPHGSAIFFRLHHAVADGVGGNAILAALTDGDRDGEPLPPPETRPGGAPEAWDEPAPARELLDAVRRRVAEDAGRVRDVASAALGALRRPRALLDGVRSTGDLLADLRAAGASPLRAGGRARHLAGLELDFEALRGIRKPLDVKMVDLMLAGVAAGVGDWYRAQGLGRVPELLTLVPINLRPREDQGLSAGVGNRATGILVRVPIGRRKPLRRLREIHRRVEERKAHPSARLFPVVAEALAALPRPVYRRLARASSEAVDLIVTNVPGVPMPRFAAGAEIKAAYPFAPVAPHCPISVALYGYRGRLYVGLDTDATAVPDLDFLRGCLAHAFDELVEAGRGAISAA